MSDTALILLTFISTAALVLTLVNIMMIRRHEQDLRNLGGYIQQIDRRTQQPVIFPHPGNDPDPEIWNKDE